VSWRRSDRVSRMRPKGNPLNADVSATLAPYLVLDGVDVYALAPAEGREFVVGDGPFAQGVASRPATAERLIAAVTALGSPHPSRTP
jgi:hypothetical protein